MPALLSGPSPPDVPGAGGGGALVWVSRGVGPWWSWPARPCGVEVCLRGNPCGSIYLWVGPTLPGVLRGA